MAAADAAEIRVLRAKYLDWCSARLADQFLALSPDEIYDLAQSGSRGRNPETGSTFADWDVAPSDPDPAPAMPDVLRDWAVFASDPASFPGLVTRVTEALVERLHLPSFEQWVVSYREDPQRFEDELLGLWRGGT